MTDVVATLDAYSKLNCLDLLTEIPTCEYEGNIDGIHVFSINQCVMSTHHTVIKLKE